MADIQAPSPITQAEKENAISFKFGPRPDLDPAIPDGMDDNHLSRIQEATTYHSPTEAKIREYKDRARTVAEAEKQPAGASGNGSPADASGGVGDAPASSAGKTTEEIVEGDQTYTVEHRPDGYYITEKKSQDGTVTPYDGGIKLGSEAPKGTEQGFIDKLKQTTLKDVAVGAGNAVKGAFVGADIGLMKLATNAVRTLVDNPVGKFYVGEQNVEAFNTFANWLGTELDKAGAEINKDTTAGKVGAFAGEVGGQFVAPALGAYKGLRALGANPLVAAALGDIGVAIFGVNPDDPNLANMLPDDPKYKAVKDLLAVNPDDSSWANRARNATEALVTLGVADVGARSIVSAVGAANKFIKDHKLPEQFMKGLDRFIQDETGSAYFGGHRPPTPEYGAPAHDLTSNGKYPADVYSDKAVRYYGHGGDQVDLDKETIKILHKIKGNPDAEITIYRGVPATAGDTINEGDWVTVNKKYAALHGEMQNETGYKILEKKVKASEIYTDANSIHEFGYHPKKLAMAGGAAIGAGAALSPDKADASVGSDVLEKAIKLLGPVKAGEAAISDAVVADMRAAAAKGDFVGFGTEAVQGIDFNVARMQSGEEIGDLINKVSEVYADPINKAKRGVQTFDETQIKADLSRQMGFNVETILKRPDGSTWNAEQMKAARDIFVGEATKTRQLAEAIKQPGGDSQEALFAFRRQLAVLSAVQMQIKGAQTEAARSLSQFRMTAKSPIEASVNIREMLDQSGGHDVNSTMVDAFLNAVQNGPADAAARFAHQAQAVTTSDMLYEAWINSLLGSPVTHIVNVSGNALATAQGVVERYGAAAYGAGERTVLRMMGRDAQGGVGMSEANAYARGMAFGVWDSLRAAGKAFKTGQGTDMFQKLGYGDKITAQNINQLPIAKSIAGRLGKDELLKTNSTMALFADRLGEYYYRLPGRFLMAEDEFFKTLTYRAELNAQSAREAMSLDMNPAQAAARRAEILDDPQVAAPNIHLASIDNAREFTFTQPAGEFASQFQKTLNSGKIGDVPVGRVVIPFFNVINNITKFVGSRTPGFALLNPNSKTYKDLFSGDPAKRQLVMGKWATGGAIGGWAAWMNQNGEMTGRLSDNPKIRKQMQMQGKQPYAVRVPMPDGTYKMAQYNRLEPIGMIMGIAATTSEVLNHVDSEEEQQSIVIAATSAILPYLEDKSFFKGATDFANALFPQYGDDDARAKAMGDYFIGLGASVPGALLGPAAPGTPLSRWARKEIAGDETVRGNKPNPYKIAKDKDGEDILLPNDEFGYRTWEGIVKKIMDATPGLSSKLPPAPNLWGEDVVLENGVYSSSAFSPIMSSTIKYDVKKLEKTTLPQAMKNGYFNGHQIGRDITLEQFADFIKVVGIDGELERLGSPIPMPSKTIAAKNGSKNIGLPVKMNDEQYYKYMQILNKVSVPNEADSERRSMNLREYLDWTVKQPAYAMLPEDGDAKKAKGDILKEVVRKYRIAADNLFMEDEPLLRKHSITQQIKAQNTGVQ